MIILEGRNSGDDMKKNAFTLIELIAVLVIMAVVALVVAPLILDTIRKAKYSVNMRSIDGYGRAIDLAMADYLQVNFKYTDNIEDLDIDYHGNKVECDITRINPDHTIYLSGCKVNGKYVKSDKNKDGYYHYGRLKMTNIEYVDTYGKNLEKALKKYHDEHGEYPSDYTQLVIEELDKEVSCDAIIQYDGTVYLENCKVNNETVLDGDNSYTYGDMYATTELLKKTNGIEITNYTDGDTGEMYTFEHDATVQTPALTDYRYIGNGPNNYVKFNGDETWRVIGVFDTEDGKGKWSYRIKLVRGESIGDMAWNSSNVNEWVESSLQLYLNNEYSITELSKLLIDNTKYYLGADSEYLDGEYFYNFERGIETYQNVRSTNWVGKIGLMYLSDYLYTFSLGVDDTCYNTPYSCGSSHPNLSWLFRGGYHQWTITPYPGSDDAYVVVNTGRIQYFDRVTNIIGILPSVYLKPNVKIKSGDGTIDNPYEFEL